MCRLLKLRLQVVQHTLYVCRHTLGIPISLEINQNLICMYVTSSRKRNRQQTCHHCTVCQLIVCFCTTHPYWTLTIQPPVIMPSLKNCDLLFRKRIMYNSTFHIKHLRLPLPAYKQLVWMIYSILPNIYVLFFCFLNHMIAKHQHDCCLVQLNF